MKIQDYIEPPLYMDSIMPDGQKDIIKILVGQGELGKSDNSSILRTLSSSSR